ncbi:DEAD/DEAH box helicase [bacterium]|nr:DEAD/DEAH box helicase [bacterium]
MKNQTRHSVPSEPILHKKHAPIDPSSDKSNNFAQFEMPREILKAVIDTGYTEPTPIQAQAIPLGLNRKDIIASAQTGSGKTAAFMLPALAHLTKPSTVKNSRGPRVLVLTPTRELALQVTQAAKTYGKYLQHLKTVSIVGGMSYDRQRFSMRGFVEIMVATPGRLIDYMQQGEIDFSRVEFLVLDEADRMLDMGFRDPVKQIVKALPKNRQTLLFSATIDRTILELAQGMLNHPERIEITPAQSQHADIEQKIHYIKDQAEKRALLIKLLEADEVEQAIVFAQTKRSADKLAENLYRTGLKAAALHGDMRQNARNRTISRLKDKSVKILVATDVAARGIDVKGITHIINYDLPRMQEDYVHRIGRTGRAGAKGTAISLALLSEYRQVRELEKFTGHKIEVFNLPGFEVTAPSYDTAGAGRQRPGRSGRNSRGRNNFRRREDSSSSGRGEKSFSQRNKKRGFAASRSANRKPSTRSHEQAY